MPNLIEVSIEDIRKHFQYDKISGQITKSKTGKKVGSVNSRGYLIFGFNKNGRRYIFSAHRVAWALMHNEWPSGCIDHINFCKTDNRILNLRDVTRSQNLIHRPDTATLGVKKERNSKNWSAVFRGKHLGSFKTPEEAKDRYLQEKSSYNF
jgi:HNH endonuclease